MGKLRTVFFGTPDFALSSLESCLKNTDCVLVVTQPDRPRGRGHKVLPCEVKARALEAGVRVVSPESLRKPSIERDETLSLLASLKPDLIVVTAYGNLLPQAVLDAGKYGSVNVHASLLPRWRGAAPIQRAIEAGDRETGVSLQKMVMELDAGDVILEKRRALDGNIQAPELWSLLAADGGELLNEFFQNFANFLSTEQLVGRAQEKAQVTLASKITKEEVVWSPSWTAIQAHNKVRAFRAWPVVKMRVAGDTGELKILRTTLLENATLAASMKPGEIHVGAETGVLVRCADSGALVRLEQVQAPTKAPMDAALFFKAASKFV